MPHGDEDEHEEERREEEERIREAKAELLESIQEILEEYNYLESDVPAHSIGYWALLNMYRGM